MNESLSPSLELARNCRISVLNMITKARASHVGSALSCIDLLAVLYSRFLKIDPQNPTASHRDRFIFSKGHAGAALYSVLSECGFFSKEILNTYCSNGSKLGGHVTTGTPGVEFSSGSLGHGLSFGAGIALSNKRSGNPGRVYVLLSDGECDEGSIWEAALFSGHHNLNQLCVIVDYNKVQSFGMTHAVLDLEPFEDKWKSFGWQTFLIDGHSHEAISETLQNALRPTDQPTVILANTIKGKGVSFMENKLEWHYRSPSAEELDRALTEILGQG